MTSVLFTCLPDAGKLNQGRDRRVSVALLGYFVFVDPVSGHAMYSKSWPPSCGITTMFFIIGVGSGCCPSRISLTRTIFCETEYAGGGYEGGGG